MTKPPTSGLEKISALQECNRNRENVSSKSVVSLVARGGLSLFHRPRGLKFFRQKIPEQQLGTQPTQMKELSQLTADQLKNLLELFLAIHQPNPELN